MPHTHKTGWRTGKDKGHVFIAIPSYGDLTASVASNLIGVTHDLSAHGWDGTVFTLYGDCHVDDARNALCSYFLDTEATHLMFIDADLGFSSASVRKLLEADKNIAAGVYPFKRDHEGYPWRAAGREEDGLIEAKFVPGGFMCIKREVIERLFKKNAKKGVWPHKGDKPLPMAEIFHRTIQGGKSRQSGDIEFCEKARKAGYSIWVNPELAFSHVGLKIWKGHLGNYLRKESGEADDNAREALKGIDGTPEHFHAITTAYGNEPFAIDHTLLGVLWFQMKALGGGTFLETGTGVSTAMFCAEGWKGISLEHSKMWRGYTEDFMDRMGIENNSICLSPLEDDGWYGYRQHDFQPDLVFIDGPVRKVGGERAGIITHCRDLVRNAKALVVDDTDDGDGLKLLGSLEELGWKFQVVNGPRRKFAIGEKNE